MAGHDGSGPPRRCPPGFPKVWASFVEAVVDTAHANGPAAPRRDPEEAPSLATVLPGVERLLAIGDLHGDLDKARRAFRLAGLVDDRDRWAGGAATAVQVGDILDRGDAEIQLFFWLERLQRQAAAAGGALHVLNGNHETMSAARDFRFATAGGLDEFSRFARAHALELALKARCGCFGADGNTAAAAAAWRGEMREFRRAEGADARYAALRPGTGPLARRFLAPHPLVLQVGATVFAHGGVLPVHAAQGLPALNAAARAWLQGAAGERPPRILTGRSAVVWARDYSAEDAEACDCAGLAESLARIPGAARMVVGHTIQQEGINSACGGRVFRVDVGLSRGCGDGLPAVLEIRNDSVMQRLMEAPAPSPLPQGLGAQEAAEQLGRQPVPVPA
uniref:Calcineurin-like phosphoesterase domain-containing protein n=1 Tax=Auxenochlorella protothecoides TaxID=3075 RepID=A0A1D1ZTH0_AUXPR